MHNRNAQLVVLFLKKILFCSLGTGDSPAHDRKVKASLKTSRNEKDSSGDALVLPEIRLNNPEDHSWH